MKSFFFGNYFYGVCVVALSIEATRQQQIAFAPIVYYLFIFCATVVFYTKAYISETINVAPNKRSVWYVNNKKSVFTSQVLLTVLAVVFGLLLLPNIIGGIKNMDAKGLLYVSIVPIVGFFYYGFTNKLSLRNTHWLKPFVIGFVWAGLVTLFPLFYTQLQLGKAISVTSISLFLFIKNLMFIAVLCIMFDIKDYATDYNQQLKTFVVSYGLRKTIFNILFPLIIIGFASFLVVTTSKHFSLFRIGLNAIPFLLVLLVAYSMHQRKSIFYYLVIIDGLMLAKAIFGCLGMIDFS